LRRLMHLSPTRVRVIPLGVNPNFRPTPSDLRQRLNLPNGRLILHIGGNQPRKNVGLIVQALRSLPDDVTLVQVGGELAPAPRIRSLSFVPESDLAALYSLADVFVFPSKYEGFGLPPLEAMACGTPAIVANTSSLPEVVGDAALLVSPDDPQELAAAIQRILTEPDLAAALRERGLARARQYTWERTARETLAVYQEVWAEAKGR
jgi:glycosyltransferase involved in cell wall biosynthesis